MKIAVCDDMYTDSKNLTKHILQYSDKFMLDFEIDTFDSGEALLAVFQKAPYKIIFLDIFMNKISGIDTAIKIRSIDEDCIIIFITSSSDYYAESFEVGATHYILKPYTCEKIETALNRCKRIFAEGDKYFSITSDRHIIKICLKDILYVEVYGKTLFLHTLQETYKTYTPLSKIAEELNSDPFLLCHRSYIVNMNFILEMLEDGFRLKNGDYIPIRRNGRQELKDKYNNYLFRAIRNRHNTI